MPPESKSCPHVSRGQRIQYETNRLLSALPPDEFRRLAPHLTEKPLTFKQSLSKAPRADHAGVLSPIAACARSCPSCGTVQRPRWAQSAMEDRRAGALLTATPGEPSESLVQVPGRGVCYRQTCLNRNWRATRHPSVDCSIRVAFTFQVMQSAACNTSLSSRATRLQVDAHG